MDVFYPSYYKAFKCIGGECRHNCCIGWEIDIDPVTYEKYQEVSGKLGARLNEYISVEDIPHFILQREERCPFLNRENLCDIILEKGEDFLCQICADHPRFRNFFERCTEVGLGLCCEEAARLVLSQKELFSMAEKESEILTLEEQSFFRFRNDIFKKTGDRTKSLAERILSMCKGYGIAFPKKSHQEWADIFLSLEHLDERWVALLTEWKQAKTLQPSDDKWDIPIEQLFSYFIYRHLAGGLEDGRYGERILFAVLGCFVVSSLAVLQAQKKESFSFSDFTELVRMYSSEIEYSEGNTETLLEYLES